MWWVHLHIFSANRSRVLSRLAAIGRNLPTARSTNGSSRLYGLCGFCQETKPRREILVLWPRRYSKRDHAMSRILYYKNTLWRYFGDHYHSLPVRLWEGRRQFFHIRQTSRTPQHPDNSHAGLASTGGCHSLKIHFPFTFDDRFSLGSITLTECLLPDTPAGCCPPSVQQSLHTRFPATGLTPSPDQRVADRFVLSPSNTIPAGPSQLDVGGVLRVSTSR